MAETLFFVSCRSVGLNGFCFSVCGSSSHRLVSHKRVRCACLHLPLCLQGGLLSIISLSRFLGPGVDERKKEKKTPPPTTNKLGVHRHQKNLAVGVGVGGTQTREGRDCAGYVAARWRMTRVHSNGKGNEQKRLSGCSAIAMKLSLVCTEPITAEITVNEVMFDSTLGHIHTSGTGSPISMCDYSENIFSEN